MRRRAPITAPHQENVKDLPGLAAFAAMGMTLAGCEAIGVLFGVYLDRVGELRSVGSFDRDSVGDGRRRGERCKARTALTFKIDRPC